MRIKQLRLKNFTVFEDATFSFSPGLNVLIGANATGKSHVLKAAYALLKAWDESSRTADGSLQQRKLAGHLTADKFARIFKPIDGELRRLVRNASKVEAEANIVTDANGSYLRIRPSGNVIAPASHRNRPAPCLFMPARDVLSMYEGFIAAYSNRELAFDETYYDVCVALSASPLKEKDGWAQDAIRSLGQELGGDVRLRGGRFFVGKLEAQLVAEGLRKVAAVVQLLKNGSLARNTVFFWDEPEAGLNPHLIKKIARLLLSLSQSGLQIVVTSHDYLLTSEISLAAEYETEIGKAASPRFFCLSRPRPTLPVQVEAADTLSELEHNPILEEFAAHYDRQHAMFVRGPDERE